MRRLRIEPALNSYIVNVDCQKLVYASRSSMLAALDHYLENPTQVEKDILSSAINPVEANMPEPELPRVISLRKEVEGSDDVAKQEEAGTPEDERTDPAL